MKKRFLLWILALCLTLCLPLLASCGGETQEDGTTENAQTTETTPVARADVELVVDGKANYTVIRDEDASTASTQVVVSRNITEKIKKLTGATVKMSTDWHKKDVPLNSDTYEILVGVTEYPETRQVYQDLKYGDVAIQVVGHKIVLAAYTDGGLSYVCNRLNRMLESLVSEDGKSLVFKPEAIELKETDSGELNQMPVYEGGEFSAFYDAGDNCNEVIYHNTNPQEYQAFLDKLKSLGYEEYTTHQMVNNLFATYNNDKYTVTVGYYDYEQGVRILCEPKVTPVGLPEDNKYTKVTTPQITMLGLEYKESDGSYASNGLCVLIRLADGRFIVIDGGFNRANTANQLLSAMKEQSKDYAKNLSDITVAGWFITHSHGDHNGNLNGRYGDFRAINVERVLVNYMSESERLKAIGSSEVGKNWSSGEGGGSPNTYMAAKVLGAEMRKVHVGQVYYFADVKIEILYTLESFAPQVCNALNTSSVVMKLTFDDGTTYMSTGDATGPGFNICNKMYGDYMKVDIVQVAHHGYTTWGNDAATAKAYQYMNAPTVLWPQGLTAYPNYRTKSYNAVLFETPNYKEVYVAGSEGDKIVVPIPYTVGKAIETRK